MSGSFTILVIDGHVTEICDLEANFIRFGGLTWEESLELVRLSFKQGHEVVIWREEGEVATHEQTTS